MLPPTARAAPVSASPPSAPSYAVQPGRPRRRGSRRGPRRHRRPEPARACSRGEHALSLIVDDLIDQQDEQLNRMDHLIDQLSEILSLL